MMVTANDRLQRITVARKDRITRSSRLRLLARQIAAGEYHVDADRLAEVLVERAQFHRQVRTDLTARAGVL
ncbi:flagellar biosynthesis anti-sigma factor FlgM [Conexibacter sp. JD483]|uniref:flagellar biosynthesis anti-sigma factor FlgM n=1 Tax=unclassified Conexibacter TaxID=2627773 RepID=UPI00271F48B6|nr:MULTISPECIES: flagellar biosynthesis anti-sigma factor FlgM [unclassified Conexibacter]MDO8187106.1 flagellar biosynthesis anti-sigma factor FlgM [Conexibacter sp. CPCC 205706]MDO8200964.1 flagellar biosynthesis anti-sigma factor FlgM [Conexibacter sp. CPCC 205762]MDR9371883.1 flagellar biosynthesis anti-sigma factor FlgM [Conexibacter sp. JD483]